MAIYHLSVKPVSRSSGRSATASAAYRAAERIDDRRTGDIHDYTRKRGVESTDIVLPDNAPTWASDRATLWNAAELAEKRKDACVAREYEVALPSELTPTERRRLVIDFAKAMANREGCAVDVCIHAPGRGGDERNHHAHLLRTTRKVEADGLGAKLDTEKAGRNRKEDLENVRAQWAELVNERLRENCIHGQVDHRSLEAQGIERQPTQHLGPAVSGLVRRGANSDVARRMAEEANARLFAARELGRIERELDRSILDLSGNLAKAIEERDTTPPPGLDRGRPAITGRFDIKAQNAARERERREQEAERDRERRDPAYRREKAEKTLLAWDAAVQREAADVIQHIRADTLAKARQHVEQWQAHIDNKPLLFFGERARNWQKTDDEMNWQDAKNRRNLDEINEEGWPMNNDRQLVIQQAAEQAAAKHPELVRQARAAQNLINEENRRERERQAQEHAQMALEREFKGLAANRAMQANGYTDNSQKWQATPKLLREIIDLYNSHTKDSQERGLAEWMRDPEKSKAIKAMIEERKENTEDHGMSR